MSRKLPKVLNEEEQENFLKQFNTRYPTPHRNLCMTRLMLEAGLRSGEVVALKPEHIDLNTGRVIVRDGKGGSDRTVWIEDDLCDLISSWQDRAPESPYLFPTSKGKMVDTRYLRAMVSRLARKAGIQEVERVSPHTMRHSAATDMLRKTGNVELVRKMLGHKSVATTQLYCHLVDDDLKAVMRKQLTAEV